MVNKSRKMAPATTLVLPKMTTSALVGKQSVRTSFRLSEACIHAMNIVTTQLGLKHRSLFDYLVEDIDALGAVAKKIAEENPPKNRSVQKSFIISRESLAAIDDLCDKLSISRDTLIEHSVRRLLPIIEKEIENHRKRKHVNDLVESHFKDTKGLLSQIKVSVGAEDPIYRAFKNTVATCKQVKSQISDIISKGKVLEGFDPNSLKD